MENDVSPAPRSDLYSMVMPLFDGLPKGSVVLLLATASWFFGTLSMISLWRGIGFLARHWPL